MRCCVRSADSRLINSRKVLLRVSVLVQADGYEPQTQSMSVLKDPPACLQLKTQTYETNAPVELSERAFQESVLLVTGVQLEPVASEQSQKLLFGAGLLAQCMVVQPQALTLCEDAYSTKGEFQPQWETQEHTMRLDAQTLREPVRASFPDAQALERTDDGVTVHVPLRADLVYTDPDGAVQAETFRTEVSCHTALSENGLCEAVCTIQPEGYASAGSGAVELRYDAVFQVQTFSRQTLQNLSGGTLDLTKQQNTQRPSVVIRRMSENAALWDLARQYRTTAQSIQQANHLTQPEADAGQLLLIPM